jgi:ATP-dependent helicase/nuclease subunit A
LGLRLRELKREHFRVWDGEARQLRPVEWRDMVILLRSPRYKSESYAKEFARLGVPLQATRGGFYESTEITDLLSLLQLLDNPLQDLPLLAVLRSPLVGLTLDELAQIRLVHRQGHFWTALQRFRVEISDFRFQISNAESAVASGRLAEPGTPTTLVQTVTEAHPGDSASGDTASNQTDAAGSATAAQSATDVGQQSLRQKVVRFLSQFSHWRSMTRQLALSQSLETILDETHYESWLITQSRGKQRQANVQRLLILTRQFDQFQRQGLFRFLKFVESQKEAGAEIEPASGDVENAVQLMSIHQSKGLEFPIVALADLGKPFNLADLRGDIIVDEEFGLCPKVKPPHSGQSYPSLPYWLAKRRQKRELLGEEIRLFYVACTRACDLLLLTGTVALKTAAEKWSRQSALLPAPQQLLAARSYLDWLGAWLPAATGHQDWTVNGQWSWLAWRIHKPDDPLDAEDPGEGEDSLAPEARADIAFTSEKLASLKERLAWRYPFPGATREPAKTSVSLLRRRASAEVDEEAQPFFEFQTPSSDHLAAERGQGIGAELTAAEVGTAHHAFMQWVSLAEVADEAAFPREADRLLQAGLLSAPERRALKLDSLARFWQSDVGQQILDHAPQIHRELPFTARFTPSDFARLGLLIPLTGSQGEETAPPSSLRADSTVAGTLSSRHSDPSVVAVQDEFIVVQGVVDLAVILPREIWLLDYKTDQLKSENIAEKTAKYRPQIALYALALSRIYQLPVTHRWLHFLTLGESVPL